MTLGQVTQSVRDRLAAAGVESVNLEASVLIAFAFGVSRSQIVAWNPEAELHPDFDDALFILERIVSRREKREPLAYIVGGREFWGMRFVVNRHVLIPRQETEILVQAALQRLTPADSRRRVLDLCTGSGCVGISIAAERPEVRLTLADVSVEAIDVARDNADFHGIKCKSVVSDFFGSFEFDETWDLITCNPPYVADGDPLPPEVSEFEPRLALFAGGDGLAMYQRLAAEAKGRLSPRGALFVELGDNQVDKVSRVFSDQGWEGIETYLDYSGMPRVLELSLP